MTTKNDNNRSYNYFHTSVEDNSKTVSIKVEVGKDGVTQADIDILLAFDYEEHLQEDHDQRNLDARFYSKRQHFKDDDRDDPFDELPYVEPEEHEMTEDEKAVRAAIETLTPDQQRLLYDIYGSCRLRADIAREEGVSRAAITQRENRALERLKKALTRDR